MKHLMKTIIISMMFSIVYGQSVTANDDDLQNTWHLSTRLMIWAADRSWSYTGVSLTGAGKIDHDNSCGSMETIVYCTANTSDEPDYSLKEIGDSCECSGAYNYLQLVILVGTNGEDCYMEGNLEPSTGRSRPPRKAQDDTDSGFVGFMASI